jgi:hypothetical protein
MSETRVKEHMEVIGADGVHIGTVDRVENGRIKLTKADSGEGRHKGHRHFIDLSLVADVEGQKVRPLCERCSSRGDQRGSGCRSLPLSGAERSSFEFYSEKYFRQPLSGASNFIQTRFGL